MLILAVIARPMLLFSASANPGVSHWLDVAWVGVLLSAIAPTVMYVYARYSLGGALSAVRIVPSMFVVGMGLCLNNAIAVARGLTQKGGEFVRTPKSGSSARNTRRSVDRPVQDKLWIMEIALGIYATVSFVILGSQSAFSLFLLLYAAGFLIIGWCSRPESLRQLDRSANSPEFGRELVRASRKKASVSAPIIVGEKPRLTCTANSDARSE